MTRSIADNQTLSAGSLAVIDVLQSISLRWYATLALVLALFSAATLYAAFERSSDTLHPISQSQAISALKFRQALGVDIAGAETRLETVAERSSSNLGPTPGYAVVLFATSLSSVGMTHALTCVAFKMNCGEHSIRALQFLQALAALASLILIFATVFLLSRSQDIALLSTSLVFLAGSWGESATFPQDLIWSFLLISASLLTTALAMVRGWPIMFLLTGLLLAAVGLFWPFVMIALPLCALVIAICYGAHRRSSLQGLMALLAFAIGVGGLFTAVAHVMPFSDIVHALQAEFAKGLSERVAFNDMRFAAWLFGIANPTPLVGEYFEYIVPAEMTRLFGPYLPGSYIYNGVTRIFPEAMAAAKSSGVTESAVLFQSGVVSQPLAYAFATFPLIAKGLWFGADFVGLAAIFHLHRVKALFSRSSGWLHAAVFLTIAAILLVATLTTANGTPVNRVIAIFWGYLLACVIVDALRGLDTPMKDRR